MSAARFRPALPRDEVSARGWREPRPRIRLQLSTGPRVQQHLLLIYVVEPKGPFEDDPNVTDKRFPGNPTRSYRTTAPLRVVAELEDWQGHAPQVLTAMLDHLAQLREQGLDVIED